MKRKAAVAGYFYPGRAEELRLMIGPWLEVPFNKEKAIAVISPHAGYAFSGPVAGAVFASVILPETFVILAPSHRPIRTMFALMNAGAWDTPLGPVPVDADLADRILSASAHAKIDAEAHAAEHSLEVQLPFLQCLAPRVSIVPVAVSYVADYEPLEDLGRAIAAGIASSGRDVLIVASTDMSHYVSREEARTKDFLAIRKIQDLDPRGLYDIVRSEDISMCGFQPTAAALVAAKILGATRADLISYATSGDRTGDYREVVGYAGLRIR